MWVQQSLGYKEGEFPGLKRSPVRHSRSRSTRSCQSRSRPMWSITSTPFSVPGDAGAAATRFHRGARARAAVRRRRLHAAAQRAGGWLDGPSRIETAAAIVVLGGGIEDPRFHLRRASAAFPRAGFEILPAGRNAALENVRNLEGRLILMRQVCLEAFVRLGRARR